MTNVFDAADCILEKTGDITAMKLQKLCYYTQAWSLVWDERPLFNDKIEAWANGPVCPTLYDRHRGEFMVNGNLFKNMAKNVLDDAAQDTLESVVNFYGKHSASWLSALTHQEDPWIDARKGIPEGVRGSSEITHGAMADYYGNL